MANKKDIALTVIGILASIAVTYFVYRAEQQNNAGSDAAQQDADAQAALDEEAQEAQQQSFLSSLGSSVPSGGGATSWTGTGNTTSTDTTSTSDTQENDAAGDGFSLSSLLSQYEQSLSALTAQANTGATTSVPVYQAPVETFTDPVVTGGYPTGAAPVLNSTVPIQSSYGSGSNLMTTDGVPIVDTRTSRNVASGGIAPSPPNAPYNRIDQGLPV